jgi:hypothetical protein
MVAHLNKESVIAYSPEIYQLIDSVTDEINSCVTSGNLATINGRQSGGCFVGYASSQ